MWIIADGVPCFPTETPGVVCHRLGVGPVKPKGQSWDYGIGVRSPHLTVSGQLFRNVDRKQSLSLQI